MLINSFLVNVPILQPLEITENLWISGGIKWEHWLEMGWNVEKILEINNGGNHFSKVPVY